MTTNRMGLEQTLSDGELIVITGTDHVQCGDAAAMARELLAYRKASSEPVAFSLRFRNVDGVLNGYINTNTTFSDREKAEKYGLGGRYITQQDGSLKWTRDTSQDQEIVPLYSAPPLQAVTVPTFDDWIKSTGDNPIGWVRDAMRDSYDACRAFILKQNDK